MTSEDDRRKSSDEIATICAAELTTPQRALSPVASACHWSPLLLSAQLYAMRFSASSRLAPTVQLERITR
jgi:hypothetical protein